MIGVLDSSSILRDSLNAVSQSSGTQWQDILSLLAAIFSALLVVAAWITYMEHNRPYVTLYAETGNEGIINLVLKNSGNRAAYNVCVTTDVSLDSVYFAKMPDLRVPLVTEKNHPFIGPNQIVSGRFDNLFWRYDRRSEDYMAPCDKYAVTIQYRHKIRKFTEKYVLDLSYLEFAPRGFSRDHIGDISKTLKQIANHLPGGMVYRLQSAFRNAPSKSKKDDDGLTAVSNIKAEDAENVPK